MNYLLDTSAFLWICTADPKLPTHVRDALSLPDARLYISAASGWEIALKSAKAKIQLPAPIQEWFPAIVSHHGMELLSFEADTAIASTLLPQIHADPFDRLLVMTALERKMIFVTPDDTIKKYPKLKTLW